jgi:histidyl-tRNA synthetase
MTTRICAKLIDLESEIEELNIKLKDEYDNSGFFEIKINKAKISDNVSKAKKLQKNVINLIKKMELELTGE